ncbi:unnamed protein product [Cunninghamella echinulata]
MTYMKSAYKKSHTYPKIDARSTINSPPSLEIHDQSSHSHDIQSSIACSSPVTEPASSKPSSPLSSASLATAAHRPSSSPSSIDYGSLYEAMEDQQQQQQDEEDYNNEVPSSLNSMISLDGDELAQKIDVIEQLETITFLRVLYLGVASLDEKRLFLKKLSDGLSETLFRQAPITSPYPAESSTSSYNGCDFYERKHHLFPLNIFKSEDVHVDYSNLLEDNGVVIVEADFTHDNSTQEHVQPTYDMDFILNYVYIQSVSSHSTDSLQSILSPPDHWKSQPYKGNLFSEDTPNGIDLCVYFYHDAESHTEVTKDLEILWKIHALNIPILPILSMSNQKPSQQNTETSNIPITSFPLSPSPPSSPTATDITDTDKYANQRPIEIRRNDLANIFSKWKIKMMDISDLDIIDQPSFNQKGKSKKGINQDKVLEEKLGNIWANSSILLPTPYHILTLFQFMVIDRWVVSKLLKTINDVAMDRRNGKYKNNNNNIESIPLEMKNDNNSSSSNKSDDMDINNNSSSTSGDSSSRDTMTNNDSYINDQKSTMNSSSTNHLSSSFFTQNTFNEGKINYDHLSQHHHHHHQQQQHQHQLLHHQSIFSFNKYYKSNIQFIQRLILPFIIAIMCIFFYITPHTYFNFTSQSRWHASLVMISHQKGKTMNFMVNVYDANDKLSWAPEIPLLSTNLPLVSTSKTALSDISISYDIYPLPNNSDTTNGIYLYSISLPPCHLLDPHLPYVIQVKYIPNLFEKHNGIQGSPFYLSEKLICDDTATDGTSDTWVGQYIEMIQHFRQHALMYITHSAKIFDASLDDSIIEDN